MDDALGHRERDTSLVTIYQLPHHCSVPVFRLYWPPSCCPGHNRSYMVEMSSPLTTDDDGHDGSQQSWEDVMDEAKRIHRPTLKVSFIL